MFSFSLYVLSLFMTKPSRYTYAELSDKRNTIAMIEGDTSRLNGRRMNGQRVVKDMATECGANTNVVIVDANRC